MFAFIMRRLGVLFVILFGSSFLLYNLAAYSGDPLADLRLSTDPNRDFLMISLTRDLQLDVPPPARYFLWLKGIFGIFLGQPNFGLTREGQNVIDDLQLAIPVTIRLVLAATIIATLDAPLKEAALSAKYIAIERLTNADAVTIGVFIHPGVIAVNKDLKNIKPGPLSPQIVWNYWEWTY